MSSPGARDGRGRRRALVAGFVFIALLFAGGLTFGELRSLADLRSEVASFRWDLRFEHLVAALGLATANLFLMGSVWVGLFRAFGGRIGHGEGVRAWMTTNLGRYIPGKIWQLAGLAVYAREKGESATAALGATLVFQILSLGSGAVIAVATLGGRLSFLPAKGISTTAVVLALLLVLLHPGILSRLTRLAARLLREDQPGASVGILALARAAAVLLAAWLVYGLGLRELLAGMSVGTEAGVLVLAGFFAASYVVGYLVLLTPGGLVVREGTLAGLLAAFTPLALGVAGLAAVAARVWIVASEALAVGVAAASRRRTNGLVGEGETE
ncbi:MAG: lysylphosphatidylglycerol synthase domain-containing protein [Gemmatimonadota bacterium]